MTDQEIEANANKHFDPNSSKVTIDATAMQRVLGFNLTKPELSGLIGAPTNSTLTTEFVDEEIWPAGENDPAEKTETTPAGLLVTVENQNYLEKCNEVILYNAGNKKLGIYIKLVRFLAPTAAAPIPKGIGALMVHSMLKAIDALPAELRVFAEMRMIAAGGRHWGDMDSAKETRWGGYVVWPKYGFDGPLHSKTKKIARQFPQYPRNLGACKHVSDLLALKGGPEFWAVAGDGWEMRFDLSDGSESRKTLSKCFDLPKVRNV
jgi:hypothetical protein